MLQLIPRLLFLKKSQVDELWMKYGIKEHLFQTPNTIMENLITVRKLQPF